MGLHASQLSEMPSPCPSPLLAYQIYPFSSLPPAPLLSLFANLDPDPPPPPPLLSQPTNARCSPLAMGPS